MKKKSIDAAYGTIKHYCGLLEIKEPPLYDVNTIVNSGPKPKNSIRDSVQRRFDEGKSETILNKPNKLGRLITLGGTSDLSRCKVIFTDLIEMSKYIKKLSKIDPNLRGVVKYRQRSGYVGVHLHTNINGVPCEIQLHTPLSNQITEIAHENFRRTRSFASLQERYQRDGLDYTETKKLKALKKDFDNRCKMEQELFGLLKETNDNFYGLDRIIEILSGIDTREKSNSHNENYPYDKALNQQLISKDGQLSQQKLTSAINTVHPYLPEPQAYLIGKAARPLEGKNVVKLVTVDPKTIENN